MIWGLARLVDIMAKVDWVYGFLMAVLVFFFVFLFTKPSGVISSSGYSCSASPTIHLNVTLENVTYENREGYMQFCNVPANYILTPDESNDYRCDNSSFQGKEGIYYVVYNNDWGQSYRRNWFDDETGCIAVLKFFVPEYAIPTQGVRIVTPSTGFYVSLVDVGDYSNNLTVWDDGWGKNG